MSFAKKNLYKKKVRSSEVVLRHVPLGFETGPLQAVELSNCGAVPAEWRLHPATLDSFQAENYGFRVLDIQPTAGILDPLSTSFLHVYFTPIEGKEISCPIKIELLRNGQVGTFQQFFSFHFGGFVR